MNQSNTLDVLEDPYRYSYSRDDAKVFILNKVISFKISKVKLERTRRYNYFVLTQKGNETEKTRNIG